jgi:hypothetical protein
MRGEKPSGYLIAKFKKAMPDSVVYDLFSVDNTNPYDIAMQRQNLLTPVSDST